MKSKQPVPVRAHHGKPPPSQVRIIGGEWRRRILRFAPVAGLRPTPDRVRETLFNWLGQDLTGKRCLDLFAGSGALAFEALSRHAREVVLVERDASVRATLAAAALELGAGSRLRVGGTDALQFLTRVEGGGEAGFDLIFLDPPFNQGWHERLWPQVGELVSPGGMIYIESESAFTPPAGWQTWKSGRAGAVHYQLAKRDEHDQ
jgi:16S rRNA (guanine(966)-N(2))-methyltransferase RsmD